jgi:alkanesulfonate monooxygenase SsuD/methylene tetrahydromethanopterin reductase-like flavin-dependent oxidoreductase (luciferase family)
LAVLAVATDRAMLGTCVLQLPLRNAPAVARQAATLQALSGERFVLGLGAGAHRGEYEAAGVDFDQRGRLLDDGIAALHGAWSTAGDPELRYRQDPPVAPVPIWIGGSSEAALRRAARVGDGWVPLFVPAAQYGPLRRRLADLGASLGRDPRALVNSVVVVVSTGPDAEVARKQGALWLSDLYDLPPRAFERHLIAGRAEDCAASVAEYQEAGASHVVVMVAADETLDHFGPLAEALARAPAPLPSDRSPAPVGVAP